jgi:hypothetical protein
MMIIIDWQYKTSDSVYELNLSFILLCFIMQFAWPAWAQNKIGDQL